MIRLTERCPCGAKLEITVQATGLVPAPPKEQMELAADQLAEWNTRHRACPGKVTEIKRVFNVPTEDPRPDDQADPCGPAGA